MKLIPALFCTGSLLLPITSGAREAIATQLTYAFPSAQNLRARDRSIASANPDAKLSAAKDEFSLLRQERIGNLRIGLAEKKVKKLINCSLKREPEKLWGADGAYHQQWQYADCGITLSMVSEKKGALKSIESITLTSPSRLRTTRGLRIGSSERAVMQAYKSEWNRESSKSGIFVAGSIYGGLIFHFQDGKVSKIFLGAAAE